MYKGRSASMQRGASSRDREVMSKEDFYKGIKIVLTKAERVHFEMGSNDKFTLLDKVEPAVRSYARNGFRRPKDVARLLNKAGVTTACGAKWTPRLAWFLLGFLFDEDTRRKRLARSRKMASEAQLTEPSSGARRKGPAAPRKQPMIIAANPLTNEEIARRLAVLGRVRGPNKAG
jgi:hypothetical protein